MAPKAGRLKIAYALRPFQQPFLTTPKPSCSLLLASCLLHPASPLLSFPHHAPRPSGSSPLPLLLIVPVDRPLPTPWTLDSLAGHNPCSATPHTMHTMHHAHHPRRRPRLPSPRLAWSRLLSPPSFLLHPSSLPSPSLLFLPSLPLLSSPAARADPDQQHAPHPRLTYINPADLVAHPLFPPFTTASALLLSNYCKRFSLAQRLTPCTSTPPS